MGRPIAEGAGIGDTVGTGPTGNAEFYAFRSGEQGYQGIGAGLALFDKPFRQAAEGGEFFDVSATEKFGGRNLNGIKQRLLHICP